MDFLELATRRYSARAYSSEPLADGDLARILEVARLAPTAANKQPFRLMAIPSAGHEGALERIYHRPWFRAAPVVLAVFGVPAEGWVRKDGKNHTDIDAAIVMDHVTLAATALGYGTCWVCNFDAVAARDVVGVPAGVEPVAFTPIGRATDAWREKVRKPLESLLLKISEA